MNMLGLSSSVRLAHRACYRKVFLLHYAQVLCQSRLCKADHVYLTYLMLHKSSLYSLGEYLVENTVSNSSSNAALVSVAEETIGHVLFTGRYHATDDLFWFHYSGCQVSCHSYVQPRVIRVGIIRPPFILSTHSQSFLWLIQLKSHLLPINVSSLMQH
jgi:hypothetical protein